MAQEQAASVSQEESMEDILHSIRDIIADESKAKPAEEEIVDLLADEEDDVLELTEVVEDKPVEAAKPVAPPAPPAPPVEKPVMQAKDILEDIDSVLSDDEAANQITASNPPVIQEPVPQPVAVAKPAAPKVEQPAPAPKPAAPVADNSLGHLLSQSVAQATSQHMKNLLNSVPKPDVDSPPFRAGHTLEDLVVETMKPMLAEWLNVNLPVIVKDLVEKEIRRLVPRE